MVDGGRMAGKAKRSCGLQLTHNRCRVTVRTRAMRILQRLVRWQGGLNAVAGRARPLCLVVLLMTAGALTYRR